MITAADLIGMKEKGAVEGRMVDASSIRHGYVEEKHPSSGFWARIIKKIELQPTAEQLANPAGRWSNPDLDPVLPKDRTWRSYNFVMYWISDAFAPGNWRLGSSLIITGLSWKLTLFCITLAHLIIAITITLNGVVGSRLHIAFTIQSRAAFGVYLSFVVVVIRMIVAVFWYGINTYTGAECVRSMIYALSPRFRNVPNHLPESANITTQMMICYFIYFILVLPFHWIPPKHIRWFFTIKSTVTPIAGISIMFWLIRDAHAITAENSIFKKGSTISGSQLRWAFMSGLNAMLGNYATLAVNINDFTRYAKNPKMTYIQIIAIPLVFVIMGFWGIVLASGTQNLYSEILWDPLLLVDRWHSPGGRAAAFFAALAFCFAQIGANISANSISAGNDMNAIAPRFINIRRGQIITAFVGAWLLTPWNILTSAAGLLNFMSGYTIWLAPITGILLADYYILRTQRLSVSNLYLPPPSSIYSYNKYGTNWRAVVPFIIGWIPLLPGFAASVNANIHVSSGAINLYNIGYFYGIATSFVLYLLLSKVSPPTSTIPLDPADEDFVIW